MSIPLPATDARQGLRREVEAIRDEILDLSHRVHANPELAFEERQASAWTASLLARHGFSVTQPFGGLETAIEARWQGRGPGPVIGILGEYDALPEIGHGCGHNLMCSSSAGAAIALSRTLGRDFDGEIRFVGTPAEEVGNGKVYLIEAGAFRDVSVALQVHPGDETKLAFNALALQEVAVEFHGKSAHAAVDPWNGLNALDALVTLFNLLSQWRQHLRPGERVHGVITHGGAAPNIIPDETAARFFLRSPVDEHLDGLLQRFTVMADSAASAAGCTVDVIHSRTGRSRTLLTNAVLADLFRANLAEEGWEVSTTPDKAGSTDMGDVSHELPTLHPKMQCAPAGTPGHSREFSACAAGPEGDRLAVAAATVVGLTALDLLADTALVERAWSAFREQKGVVAG